MIEWYREHVLGTGRSPALWLVIGFVVTFVITRRITLRIKAKKASGNDDEGGPQDVFIGGVHVHHQVWGILLVLITGLIHIRFRPEAPWAEILAAMFGAGAALALDEFALWLHLEDVYWTDEGRKSIDAVMIACVVGFGMLMATSPLGIQGEKLSGGAIVLAAVLVAHVSITIVCLLKGKLTLGLLGLPVPMLSVIGAVRLAKPGSFWAKRFYGERKTAKAQQRFGEAYVERREAVRDLFSGTLER